MGVPKRKSSHERTSRRRNSHKVKLPQLTPCPKCGSLRRSHYACPACGYYKDRQVLTISSTST